MEGEAQLRATTPFAGLLRRMREAAGLTQEELAERAGLTTYGVSALERGVRTRPYPHTVRALAEALDLDSDARAELVAAVPKRASRRAGATDTQVPAGPETVDAVSGGPDAGTAAPARDGEGVHGVPPSAALPSTPLFGRSETVDGLVTAVRSGTRLVTLTGPGGIGKTRVAAAVLQRAGADFVDGGVFVPLAHVSRTVEACSAIATAVGMPDVDGPGVEGRLREHLADRQLLLVLDNLEQIPDIGREVAALVSASRGSTVLATSRIALAVRDESVVVVPPLEVPRAGTPSLDEVAASSAGALFLDRARAGASHLPLTDADAADVAELCRRLAGIPLVLELVAAQLRTLAPAQVLVRLGQLMRREGPTDLPDRQRTVHAALEWSRELLTAEEQRLFATLSVFRGGFTLEAVEAVSGDPEAWTLLERLVEQSLVQVDPRPQRDRRYRLLEPVAQYADSLLDDSSRAGLRSAHAAWVLELTERAAPEYTRADQIDWLNSLDLEDANLAAALRWSLGDGRDAATAARIGWGLWLFWWLRGRLQTGRSAMEQALRHELPDGVRARALLVDAAMSFAQGDLDVSEPGWREAGEIAEATGDVTVTISATAGRGLVALARGDLDGAEAAFLAALDRAAPVSGWAEDWVAALTRVWLGTVALARGETGRAEENLRVAVEAARSRGDRLTTYIALYNLAQVELAAGDHDNVRRTLEEAAALSAETRDAANLSFVLEAAAVLEGRTGRHDRVPVLVGAAEVMRESAGGTVYGYYLPDDAARDAAVAAAREALGKDRYEDALDEGRTLRFDEAVAAFRSGPADPQADPPADHPAVPPVGPPAG